jgi:NTP pyrophosphatase (non-canonical NTP hydrolase)
MSLTFDNLRKMNVARCEKWHNGPLSSWSLSDWATAAAGELGEACNIIKKLNRVRDGLGGNKGLTEEDLRKMLAKELADTQVYLDLLAAAAGINLGEATREKFNAVSEEKGFEERI